MTLAKRERSGYPFGPSDNSPVALARGAEGLDSRHITDMTA
jgi:hypothetical protein